MYLSFLPKPPFYRCLLSYTLIRHPSTLFLYFSIFSINSMSWLLVISFGIFEPKMVILAKMAHFWPILGPRKGVKMNYFRKSLKIVGMCPGGPSMCIISRKNFFISIFKSKIIKNHYFCTFSSIFAH